MVDFSKKLNRRQAQKPVDPLELYQSLDRASDKGPLRPAQESILNGWNDTRRNDKDVIVKLHTGQGKTLIGLVMLQSLLNDGKGPSVYLCPNNFLVNQTLAQAEQFGIDCCEAPDDLPVDFLDGSRILITSVQKLFNGLTKFKLDAQSVPVSAVVMDDAHACVDSIREATLIRLLRSDTAYGELRELFKVELRNQGMGTYADIEHGEFSAVLPVPYWDWQDKQEDVVRILSRFTSSENLRFIWPLLRDSLADCLCMISGSALEIAPYMPPLHRFGSFHRAEHRIFMSATVTNDAFLIKGLGLSPDTIASPLVYTSEPWSGEKMILIPSLIDESLDRSKMVVKLGKPDEKRSYGVLVLAPSFNMTRDWEAAGAVVAKKETIDQLVAGLLEGNRAKSIVVANRYDGIDLPDAACRILVFDSKPYTDNLGDRYSDSCRPSSMITAIKTVRTIEQGLGRSVRGEKDYCAIVVTGSELVKCLRTKESRRYLSDQTRAQIDIGLGIAELAKDDIGEDKTPEVIFVGLVNQCLRRDPDWKAYYVQQMDAMESTTADNTVLQVFKSEMAAERNLQDGRASEAAKTLQNMLDGAAMDDAEKGWYLQEMARYTYASSRQESNELQVSAHRKNRMLLKPRNGMQMDKLTVVNYRRMELINTWIRSFEHYSELSVVLDDMLGCLRFGVAADRFEDAFDRLSSALGFPGQRPEKEWKEGPDNLWLLQDGKYLLIECKSEVLPTRREINEHETEQMNRSYAWFKREYPNVDVTSVMIIPCTKLANDAGLLNPMRVMDEQGLNSFTNSVRLFFKEFANHNLRDLSEPGTQSLIDRHHLSVSELADRYTKPARS